MFPMMAEALAGHDFKHAIHNALERHHKDNKHSHSKHKHDEDVSPVKRDEHHPIVLDPGGYLKDFLFVDTFNHNKQRMQKNNKTKNKFPHHPEAFLTYAYGIGFSSAWQKFSILAFYKILRSGQDLYLQTQRFRT